MNQRIMRFCTQKLSMFYIMKEEYNLFQGEWWNIQFQFKSSFHRIHYRLLNTLRTLNSRVMSHDFFTNFVKKITKYWQNHVFPIWSSNSCNYNQFFKRKTKKKTGDLTWFICLIKWIVLCFLKKSELFYYSMTMSSNFFFTVWDIFCIKCLLDVNVKIIELNLGWKFFSHDL